MRTRSFPLNYVLAHPVVIVVAHPDDEALGLGTLLPKFRELRAIIHVTDGAPRRGPDVANAGASSREEYASLRRRELEAALRKGGVRVRHTICLGYPDQEASFHMAEIATRLASRMKRLRPAYVFTHSYEGGHPDHDGCAAAVAFAALLLRRSRAVWRPAAVPFARLHRESLKPEILEFASYHAAPGGGLETECFLGASDRVWPHPLTPEQRLAKCALLSNYVSQQRVLSQFPLEREPVRAAPEYDFSRPPHQGQLYYEHFDWGTTGRTWRNLAKKAIAALGLRS